MSRLNDLLRQLETSNPDLAKDLRREVDALSSRRAFGLNFERHVPEAVELPGRPVRRGDKVRILPPRGSKASAGDGLLWRVMGVEKDAEGIRTASLELLGDEEKIFAALIENLVVVAEFRDPIYPGLVSTGKVERGGDKPHHSVINAENYYALQTLLFTHRAKVDVIYIDPPYNTGAKDWKYNNDYVEGEDLYRHSKWLAFMERRLKLARDLLNPNDSVLIVTIDEREIHRLGLLLEQMFPDGRAQMVTIVINHRGVARNREFARVEEYAIFVFFGDAGPSLASDDLLTEEKVDDARAAKVRWEWLIKGSNNALREDRPRLFYPVYIDPEKKAIADIGEALPLDADRTSVPTPEGLVAVWPISREGAEKRWQVSPDTLRRLVAAGHAKAGAYDAKNDRWSILYLNRGQLERIERGEILVSGRDANGVLELELVGRPAKAGMTVWNRGSHNAGYYGSGVISALLPGKKFPFPKSLYAVEDAIRFAVGNKPDATVVDFFAGSGTTAHAVFRLNHQDGGSRRSIMVSNNEVSADEQSRLRAEGLRPGDTMWEAHGICEYMTKPRLQAAVTGRTPNDDPVKGDYKFTDAFPIADGFEENVEFFTLTYEAPLRVSSNREFAKIAPLIWLRAGSEGRRIEDVTAGWDVADTYGVLADLDQSESFIEAVAATDRIRIVFVVTDEDRLFEAVVRELPEHVEPVRMYEAYLQNFEIETGRSAL